jgi:hypothetical protein
MHTRYILFVTVMFLCQVVLGVNFQNDSLSEIEKKHYLEENISSTASFSEARWKAAKEGTKYLPEEEQKPQKIKHNEPFQFNILPDLSVLKYVFIAFTIVTIIVLILYNFRNSIFHWTAPKPQKKFEVLEPKDLDDQELIWKDLQKLLTEAITAKEYALAIRLVYMSTLQKLIQHKFIVWKKELPNRHILRQIKMNKIYEDTHLIFKNYEQVWYGKKQVQEQDYEQINRLYTHFLVSLTDKR